MPTSHDAQLRQRVRQRMDSGRLSPAAPRETLAGPGCSCPCAVCDEIIPSYELEYEAETEAAGAQHFHFACYVAWFIERRGGL
ncbi:MAG TPA: hypothetical protein VFO44_17715 [Steroidobacteraceae bacterium]|nr:hypothetical protein [Steroidobacteraceae bacterium]